MAERVEVSDSEESVEVSDPAGGPLVSVVMPAYNGAAYVGEALDSLRAQTCAGWECVVVDDGSVDDTGGVVARYAREDARVRYVRQENGGPASARNRGIRESAGKYLQFLDADDLLAPRKLEEHVAYLESHPEADIVYGDMEYFGEGAAGAWHPSATPSGDREVLRALVSENITGIHAALSRREPVVLFDEELRGPEDWFYWISCALAGKRFAYLPGSLVGTRAQAGSLSQNLFRMYAYVLLVRHKLADSLADADLLELNRALTHADEGTVMRLAGGARDLVRVARISRRAKWLRLALTVPLARRPFVSRLRKLIGRG